MVLFVGCSNSSHRSTDLGRRWNGRHAVKVGFLVGFTRLTRPGALEFMTFDLLGKIAIVAQEQRMVITMFVFAGDGTSKRVKHWVGGNKAQP